MAAKRIVLVIVLSILLLALPTTQIVFESTAQEEKIVFVYGTTGAVNFNPLTGMSYLMYRGILWTTLYIYNETWGIEPWAAEYARRIDNLTWEIKLRDDLYWHDGEPVTAEDYKFTWDLLLKYPTAQTRFLKAVENITVVSEKVFRVRVKYPAGGYAPFLTGVCVPVPKHIWEEKGLTNESVLAYDNIPPIGMGPFKFVEYKPGEYIKFEAFDKFFAGRPKIDILIVKLFESTESMIAALKAGEVDAVDGVPPTAALKLTADPNIRVHTSTTPGYRSIYINQYPQPKAGHPALDNLTVRTAIAMCIDKEAINDLIHPNFEIGYTPINPKWPEFNSKVKDLWPKFNTTAAAELLESAGYKDTDGDGIREDPQSGKPLKFRMVVYLGLAEEMRSAELIREWFREAGMDLEIKGMEAGVWSMVVSDPHDYDFVLWAWTVHDPISCWYPYTSDAIEAGWSSSGYHSSEFDQLYQSLLEATDYDEYIAAQHALQEHFVKNIVEIVLYHGANSGAWRAEWEGVIPEPVHFGWYGYNAKAFLYIHPAEEEVPSPGAFPMWVWGVVAASVVITVIVIVAAAWILSLIHI